MNYGNLITNKIQHSFGGLFDTLSIERKQNDAQSIFKLFNNFNSIKITKKFNQLLTDI